MTGIIIGVGLACFILLAGLTILIGGVILSLGGGAKIDNEDVGFGVFMGSIIAGGIITLIGALAVGSAASKLIKYNLLAHVAIEVLDAHGVEEICRHFDCKAALEDLDLSERSHHDE